MSQVKLKVQYLEDESSSSTITLNFCVILEFVSSISNVNISILLSYPYQNLWVLNDISQALIMAYTDWMWECICLILSKWGFLNIVCLYKYMLYYKNVYLPTLFLTYLTYWSFYFKALSTCFSWKIRVQFWGFCFLPLQIRCGIYSLYHVLPRPSIGGIL